MSFEVYGCHPLVLCQAAGWACPLTWGPPGTLVLEQSGSEAGPFRGRGGAQHCGVLGVPGRGRGQGWSCFRGDFVTVVLSLQSEGPCLGPECGRGPPVTAYSELQAGPSARVGYVARRRGRRMWLLTWRGWSSLPEILLAPGTLELVQAAGPSKDGTSPHPFPKGDLMVTRSTSECVIGGTTGRGTLVLREGLVPC